MPKASTSDSGQRVAGVIVDNPVVDPFMSLSTWDGRIRLSSISNRASAVRVFHGDEYIEEWLCFT